ncbi:MAG: J domain-containing protein [Pseudomonadota bacterium]
MSEAFDYRVKFRDMRIKPPADDKSRARAQETRTCEYKGCDLAGEYKSPKHGGGYYYFCQRHAAEYNKRWNFFDGMTEDEVKDFNEAARHGHKQTWKFGTGPMGKKAAKIQDPKHWRGREMFEDGVGSAERQRKRGRTRLEIRALNELDLDENATTADIRGRYAEYVRRFHPDSNAGDRSSEDKLARVIRAWKTLKAAGLTEN